MTEPAVKTRNSLAARAIGAVLAVCALGLICWAFVLMSVEYRFRRLPALAEEEIDPQMLARMGDELERLIRLDPNNGEIRNAYASVLGRRQKNKEAVEQLEKALKILNAQNSLFFLADMYDRLGMTARAEAAMGDVVVINPSNAQYNEAWIRLLFNRLNEAQQVFDKGRKNLAAYNDARRAYAEAARSWAVRAPHDMNSYLFLANLHVSQYRGPEMQLYLVQAYRLMLLGLSRASWMDLSKNYIVKPRGVQSTIGEILNNHFAKPYRGLP
ncbi:hypothetical protein LLG95_02435 [bacterium]|nr:hypothetical protein [bacterium]